MSVNIGRVGLRLRGAYSANTVYSPLDIVTHAGCAWVAKTASTGQQPTEGAYWSLLITGGAGAASVSPMVGATSLNNGESGTVPAPSAGDENKVLTGAGTWVAQSAEADVMTGATSLGNGASGLVPAPSAGDENKVLTGAGTWVEQSAEADVMMGATSLGNGASGLVPAPSAGDEHKVLTGSGIWTDASDIGTTETVLCSTFNGSQPPATFGQSGFRGMVTRIANPGRFAKVRATVYFGSMSENDANAPYGSINVGVMSGDTVIPLGSYTDEQTFYAAGSKALTAAGEYVQLDIELDTAVDVSDEYLYVWLWNTDGSGKWMNNATQINSNVVAHTADHSNFMLGRYSASSQRCYTSGATSGEGKAAAFQIIALQNPTDIALSALDARVEALEEVDDTPLAVLKPDGGYCAIFNSIACIGDSLTAGVYEHNETGTLEYPAFANYSYPKYMQRALGNTVKTYARGGATVKSTLSEIVSDDWIAENPCDCYIIALGTNGMVYPDPLTGAVTDVNTSNMTLTDVTTDIGAYGKLIQLIRAQVPKSKIFLVTIPYTRNTEVQVRQSAVKIRALAELLDCDVIDLEQYGTPYADKAAFRAIYYTGHLNAVGYKHLATRIMTYIDWVISHDTQRFGQAAFIQTEYSYNVTPVITISGQPNDMTATEGAITGGLSVTATVTSGNIAYQWYSNSSDSNTGGTLISGATSATMALGDTLTEGSYYYYCVLSCEGATNAVSNCATVSVAASGGGTPANTVFASYTLSGTANGAAPATLADASGNNNTLTVNGVTAYNADGYLPFTASGESLSASSFSLGNATSVTLHMKMYTPSGITRQHRILYINGIDLNFMFLTTAEGGTPVNLRIEAGSSAVYVATERIGGTQNSQGYVAEFREATLDITLTDAQITVVEAVKVSTNEVITVQNMYRIKI